MSLARVSSTVVFLLAVSFADWSLADTPQTESDSKAPAPQLAALGKQSWPSFRNGNLQTGVATAGLPDELELLWTHQAGEMVVATAAIVGDCVYASSLGGEVLCLDRKTGSRIWTYQSIQNPKPKEFLPGFQAPPTVTADTVYVGDEEGKFHAIDRATGKQKWIYETAGEIHSAANVVGDKVIFGSYDYRLYCLNCADGTLQWQYETENFVNGSPAIVENLTFVTGCDGKLRAIDINTGKQKYALDLGSYIIASPAIQGDELYVGTSDGEFLAVNWREEKITWKYGEPPTNFQYRSSAAVKDNWIVVGARDKRVRCFDRSKNELRWKFPTRAAVDSSPVIVGQRVFFGSNDRNLYGVDLLTGKEFWKFSAGDSITASCAVGEGCLVVGSESRDGNIYCFGSKNQ